MEQTSPLPLFANFHLSDSPLYSAFKEPSHCSTNQIQFTLDSFSVAAVY